MRASHPDAWLYGADELEGIGVLYVLAAPPGDYGLPRDPKVPLTVRVWQDIFKPADMAAGAAALLVTSANYLIVRRRHRGEGTHGEESPAEPASRGAEPGPDDIQ